MSEKDLIVLPQFLRRSSAVFKYFPELKEVTYSGMLNGKVISFSTKDASKKRRMLMISIIRRHESDLWESYKGFILDLLTMIEPKINGIFRFELLSMHMTENMENFQRTEFVKGMTDLAHGLTIGKAQFVQYCSMLGILSKYAIEDFGKIHFTPQVQILDQEPEDLYIPLERLIKASEADQSSADLKQLIFYDLSRHPLYDPHNSEQAQALAKMSEKFDRNLSTTMTEVAVIDENGLHPLFKKSQFELELF